MYFRNLDYLLRKVECKCSVTFQKSHIAINCCRALEDIAHLHLDLTIYCTFTIFLLSKKTSRHIQKMHLELILHLIWNQHFFKAIPPKANFSWKKANFKYFVTSFKSTNCTFILKILRESCQNCYIRVAFKERGLLDKNLMHKMCSKKISVSIKVVIRTVFFLEIIWNLAQILNSVFCKREQNDSI